MSRHNGLTCILTIVLAGATAWAAPSAEEKLVADMYGQKIAAARSSPSEADNLDLAQQLMIAANDSANTKKLRFVLAFSALELTQTLTSDNGTQIAEQALELADGLSPLAATQKAQILKDLAAKRYSRGKLDGRSVEQMNALAAKSISANLDFIEAATGDTSLTTDADKSLVSVKQMLAQHRLADLAKRCETVEETYRAARVKAVKLQEALARLKTAEESKNPQAINTAKARLANVYLECDGDVVAAAEQLAGAGDSREKALAAAADFARTKKLDPATALDSAELLIRQLNVNTTEKAAGKRLATLANDLLVAFLAGKPSAVDASKARLMQAPLKSYLGLTATDKRREEILKAYDGIAGKLEVLDEENIRVVYDMSDPEQLKDWTLHMAQWEIARGVLGCKTTAYNNGEASNKLQFKANKPFRMSFRGSAKYELSGLIRYGYGGSASYSGHAGWFRLRREGTYMYGLGTSWNDNRGKLREGEAYKVEIAYDGKGTFTWSVNGSVVWKQDVRSTGGTYLQYNLSAALGTESSDRSPTIFDDVTLEGAVVISRSNGAQGAGETSNPAGTTKKKRTGRAGDN